jgi:hypothetical protein
MDTEKDPHGLNVFAIWSPQNASRQKRKAGSNNGQNAPSEPAELRRQPSRGNRRCSS